MCVAGGIFCVIGAAWGAAEGYALTQFVDGAFSSALRRGAVEAVGSLGEGPLVARVGEQEKAGVSHHQRKVKTKLNEDCKAAA
ncbi:hypothetical protein AWV80_19350 [Cupriavidus sp. UYMU48A]|nr:hypothetical protein AWV80_19350 [Cupriavidus sp. UYMU48A]